MGLHTQKSLAEKLGTSRNAVAAWIAQGMPATRLPGGAYRIDEDAARAWIAKQRGEEVGATPGATPGQQTAAELARRLTLARIAREEAAAHALRVRNRERSKKWAPWSFMVKQLGEFLHANRERLRFLSQGLAPELANKSVAEVDEILDAKMREILEELADHMCQVLDQRQLMWRDPEHVHEDDEVPAADDSDVPSGQSAESDEPLADLDAIDEEDADDE